jgi:Ribonuclease G/E
MRSLDRTLYEVYERSDGHRLAALVYQTSSSRNISVMVESGPRTYVEDAIRLRHWYTVCRGVKNLNARTRVEEQREHDSFTAAEQHVENFARRWKRATGQQKKPKAKRVGKQ